MWSGSVDFGQKRGQVSLTLNRSLPIGISFDVVDRRPFVPLPIEAADLQLTRTVAERMLDIIATTSIQQRSSHMDRNVEQLKNNMLWNLKRVVALGAVALVVSGCSYDGYRSGERQKCQSMAIDFERNQCLGKWEGDSRDLYRKAKQEDRGF
jgi:hypothetical protein